MELHALQSGRKPRVVTAMTMLKQMLFRYVQVIRLTHRIKIETLATVVCRFMIPSLPFPPRLLPLTIGIAPDIKATSEQLLSWEALIPPALICLPSTLTARPTSSLMSPWAPVPWQPWPSSKAGGRQTWRYATWT